MFLSVRGLRMLASDGALVSLLRPQALASFVPTITAGCQLLAYSTGIQPPSAKQTELLSKLGYAGPPPSNSKEASQILNDLPVNQDLLDQLSKHGYTGPELPSARAALDELQKATAKQTEFLAKYGKTAATKKAAAELIEQIKVEHPKAVGGTDGPASEKQLEFLAKYGKTAGSKQEASELIGKIKAENPVEDKAPSEKQVALLKKYGKPAPATMKEASEMIDQIKRDNPPVGAGAAGQDAPPTAKQLAFLATKSAATPATSREARELINQIINGTGSRKQGAMDGAPSDKQLSMLARHGVAAPATMKEATALIDKIVADNTKPASDKQVAFLSSLGYDGAPPTNSQEAAKLITALKAQGKQ